MIAAISAAIFLSAGASCGHGDGTSQDELEAAVIEGRMAARKILVRHWDDTLALQTEIKAQRGFLAHYDSIGRQEAAATFDSTFISTLRTVNPRIAQIADTVR